MKKILKIILITLIFLNEAKSNIKIKEENHKYFFSKEDNVTVKDWNFLVYITSNNSLYPFSKSNIQQMMQVGSNKNINILVQQDVYGKAESKRLLINKNKTKTIARVTEKPYSISGTPESLYSFVEWGIKKYPAKHQALILWNHGSGIVDPEIWKHLFKFNPMMLYKINAQTGLFELNRELLSKRGICFNEIFEVYLTNQKLTEVLEKITTNLLNGKKLDIIGMDACNMAMLEIASQIKNHANYMVASEETEPGTGWNYELVLKPFKTQSLTPKELAKNIVYSYQKHYEGTFNDFTQSAINLNKLNILEENINKISKLLIDIISNNKNKYILTQLKKLRRTKSKTTKFANPDYIDLHHFYISLGKLANQNAKNIKFNRIKNSLKTIKQLIDEGTVIIEEIVLAKTFCPSLSLTQGISFYYPTKKIHKSYKKTNFAKTNNWFKFLEIYL